MFWNTVLVIAVLNVLLLLFVFTRRIFSTFRIVRIRPLSIHKLAFVKSKKSSIFYLEEWSFGEILDDVFHKMIRSASFALQLIGIQWWIDWRIRKIVFSIDSVNVLHSPPSPANEDIGPSTSSTNEFLKRHGKLGLKLLKFFYSLLRRLFTIRVKKVNFIFAHFPKRFGDKIDFWNAFYLKSENIILFDKDMDLSIESVNINECGYNDKQRVQILNRSILMLSSVFLSKLFDDDGAINMDIKLRVPEIALWPSTMLLLTSFLADCVEEMPVVEDPSRHKEDGFKIIKLLKSIDISLRMTGLSICLHFPISKVENQRFESVSIMLQDLLLQAKLKDGQEPLFLAQSLKTTVSTTGSKVIGINMTSKVNNLFSSVNGALNSRQETILVIDKLVIANIAPQNESYDSRDVQRWITSLMQGKPIWAVSCERLDELFESTMKSIKNNTNIKHFYTNLGTNLATSRLDQLQVQKSMIFARSESIAFDVPFEYPFSNFIDHVTFFVKSVQAPFPKKTLSQEFDLFTGKNWHFNVQTDVARFSIADCPFESKLAKCLRLKQQIYRKIERLERIFWRHCEANEEGVDIKKFDNGWVPLAVRLLANASERPELLRCNAYLSKRYFMLQTKIFDLYKANIDQIMGQTKPLLLTSAADVNFSVSWDGLFGDSMAALLNAIEGNKSFSEDEVAEFGLFLGGFVDISAKNLAVTIRDYAVPLCYAPRTRIMGLLFLVEEPTYPDAIISHPIAPAKKFKHGRSNLLGLNEQFEAILSKTIMPTKIYHSISISAFGDRPVVSGFSPLFEGAFQMLDRAFDLFSKPSEELSPSLPFWDKLRLLLCGSTSTVKVLCELQYQILGGSDLESKDESISLYFPKGLIAGFENSKVRFKVEQATAYLNSNQEALLYWMYRTMGASFQKSDFEHANNVASSSVLGIPIAIFPSLDFIVSLEFTGKGGRKTISHRDIRLKSSLSVPSIESYDSYSLFRIHRLTVDVDIVTGFAESELLFFYYRELEAWVIRNFTRFIKPPVKRGNLFRLGSIRSSASPGLSSIMCELQMRLAYDGFFCIRGLQFFDTSNYGGVLLSSKGRTRITMSWRRSDYREGNPNHGLWFMYFSEFDFSNMQLGIIIQSVDETLKDLSIRDFPLAYHGVGIVNILESPRLFYIVFNEACFKNDPTAKEKQILSVKAHLKDLIKEIDSLSLELRKCDPLAETKRFASIKRELSVLLEQNEYISKFLHDDPERILVSNHQFIIQNAKFLWHQHVRDAVFALVDQEFQFFRCGFSLSYSAIRKLFEYQNPSYSSDGTRQQSSLPTSPISPASPLVSPTASNPEAVFDALLKQGAPLEVDHEDLTFHHSTFSERADLLADPHQLHQEGAYVSFRVDVNFTQPQIILLDASSLIESAVIVTAQSATLKYGTIRQSEYGELIGRRTKIVLEQAQFHGAFKSDFKAWPPSYPVEYLLTSETEHSKFKKMSEKVRVTFIYDVANNRLRYNSLLSPIRKIFERGDKIRVEAGAISLLTTSKLYTALYDVIVKLLVYRDPAQKMRHEQLESLVLATNIFNQSEIAQTIYSMQHSLLRNKRVVESKLIRTIGGGNFKDPELIEDFNRLKTPWDELALVVDAMYTVRQDRIKQRQTRLTLDVHIKKIQWTIYQTIEQVLCEFSIDEIHDCWISAEDGCQSNLIEIGSLKGVNKLPNSFYKTLIAPVPDKIRDLMHSEMGFRGIGTLGNAIRFFFKARPPVAGILVVEHVELNLAPLQIQLTFDIAEELVKFFFPDKAKSNEEDVSSNASDTNASDNVKTLKLTKSNEDLKSATRQATSTPDTASTFFSKFTDGHHQDKDVAAIMKTRASQNCSFIYITVPASQHLISYKGRGETSITDIESFLLKLPDFEYHSEVLSWLELFLKLRGDSISVLLSNIGSLVKDKIKRLGQANIPESEEAASTTLTRTASRFGLQRRQTVIEDPDSKEAQERKAKMLLGKSYQK